MIVKLASDRLVKRQVGNPSQDYAEDGAGRDFADPVPFPDDDRLGFGAGSRDHLVESFGRLPDGPTDSVGVVEDNDRHDYR